MKFLGGSQNRNRRSKLDQELHEALRDPCTFAQAFAGQSLWSVQEQILRSVAQNRRTLINGDPSEVVFTSGGTEADNLAIRGAAEALEPTGRRHLIASAIEHEAVLNTLKALARRGSLRRPKPLEAFD